MTLDWAKIDRWLVGEAYVGSRLEEHLTELCTNIGPRWATSPADLKAAEYIKDRMAEAGLSDARLEEFEMHTWEHDAAEAHLVESERPVDILPMLGCPPVDVEAPLVDVGFGMPHELAPASGNLPGAVAVVALGSEPFSTPRPVADRIVDLREVGAVAAVVVEEKSGGRMEYQMATDKRRAERAGEVLPHPIPSVLTTREHGALLRLSAAEGKRLAIRVDSRSYTAPSHNTVAEIEGSAWPGESLVLGAHHDTYPESPGGNDNSSGTVVVMETARVLALLGREMGISPGRSIRFCTWSGEEFHHQGSAAYIRRHHGSEQHPRFVVNLDEIGAGPIKGVVLQFPELRSLVTKALDSMNDGLRCHVMPQLDYTNDGFSFARAAIPYAILWRWRFVGRHPDADYRGEPADTADKVRPRELREYVAQLARVLLRLSHVPPEEWPSNELDVGEIAARISREAGTAVRTM